MASQVWGSEPDPIAVLAKRFRSVRALSRELIAPLSDADATVQSMPDASPAKWHLAHPTWFFETFVLRDNIRGYQLYDASWSALFNGHYEAGVGRNRRAKLGLLTRPTLWQVLDYRSHVDEALLDALPMLWERCAPLIELGLAREQRHQELLITDLKHLFACNPLDVSLWAGRPREQGEITPLNWIAVKEALVQVGAGAGQAGFSFENERPCHRHFLSPHALANRPINNAEWCAFIEDGGYNEPKIWPSDGWDWLRAEGSPHPLYWRSGPNGWQHFTLSGWAMIDPSAPVTHISRYEADAFCTWAGARLPTEQELEAAARHADPNRGIQLDRAGAVDPRAEEDVGGFQSLFGNVWEWSGSAYRPYPGFRAADGAVGQFMSGQFVLKGGSCATPRGHIRATYRNFLYPHQRWQFTGLRLAKDL